MDDEVLWRQGRPDSPGTSQRTIGSRARRHPLSFEQLTTIEGHPAHLETIASLQKTRRPAIVLAASGMCAGGRIVHDLKAFLGDPRTDILFVGYQAAGTPGRAIQRYGPQQGDVELDGARYPIRAGVHVVSGYSAHADQLTGSQHTSLARTAR